MISKSCKWIDSSITQINQIMLTLWALRQPPPHDYRSRGWWAWRIICSQRHDPKWSVQLSDHLLTIKISPEGAAAEAKRRPLKEDPPGDQYPRKSFSSRPSTSPSSCSPFPLIFLFLLLPLLCLNPFIVGFSQYGSRDYFFFSGTEVQRLVNWRVLIKMSWKKK